MIDIVVSLFLQVSGPAAVEAPATKPEEPKIVCTMEPVTGTRTRRQKVCKPVGGVAPGTERAQEMLRDIQRGGSGSIPDPTGG